MSTKAQAAERFDFVDAMRGLAVLFMIWMHTGDGWLQPALKQGQGWELVRAFGGLAAPLFLLLTGVSLGLATGGGGRVDVRAGIARGLRIVVLGYLLRVQMWMLDGRGYAFGDHWGAALPLLVGYGAAYVGLGRWGEGRPWRGPLLLACASTPLGIWLVSIWIPQRLTGVLRVDVLQAIGVSLALLAPLASFARRRPAAILALGALVAALTPWFRSWVPGPLPEPVAAYLGYWYPGPGLAPAGMFPLFPWLAYPCFGLVLGQHWRRLGAAAATESAIALCALGALLALASCEAFRPARELLRAWPDLVQPARVAYRVGVCLVVGGLAVLLSRPRTPGRVPLGWLGRASLMVYWVHLEFAFGMLGRPLIRQLDFRGWALAWGGLSVAMVGLSWLWIRLRPRLRVAPPKAADIPVKAA